MDPLFKSTEIKIGAKFRVRVNKETDVHFHFYLIYIVPNRFHTREAPSGITKIHYSELDWPHGNHYLCLFKIDPQQKKTSQTLSTSSFKSKPSVATDNLRKQL